MQLAGDTSWYVAPTAVVSTKYVEALRVSNGGSTGPATVSDIERSATVAPSVLPASTDTKAPAASRPVRKNVAATKTQ
jgi:hypothetical protein